MKVEWVYREILYRLFERDEASFTQRELASSCLVSLGLVNFSLRPLRRMGAVEVRQRGFDLLDPWKALMYWCAVRDLEKETVYSNLLDEPIHRIESSLPRGSIPTAYTAYRERFDDAPSDYSEVYAYGEGEAFAQRFGPGKEKGRRNIFVLKSDGRLDSLGTAPLAQVYADLWNLETWYARRFLEGLGERLREKVPGGAP
jgi:hypothetical protein